MQQVGLPEFASTVLAALAIGIAVLVVLGALATACAAAIHWIRHARSSRARETLFVTRWGDVGPELYLVGKGVRRLPRAASGRHQSEYQAGTAALDFARRILGEVMYCRPATRLARAFADEHLEPLPADGFVLSACDVEAWLDEESGRLARAATRFPDDSVG